MTRPDLAAIKLVCFDVDGVLTDGRVIVNDQGGEIKAFHSRDGHGMKMMIRAGLTLALITGRKSRVVEHRARDLGIELVYQGVLDKLAVFQELLAKLNLEPRQAAMAGDDLVDLPVMIRAGLSLAPADATLEVLARAHFISSRPGGRGAAREMAEYILNGQGLWADLLARYLGDAVPQTPGRG